MSKRILIAGGAGYIGSALTPALIARGHEVSIVDLLWFGNNLPESVDVLQEDLFNLTELDLVGFDTVIFLAGLSNDPMADFSPSANFIANTSGAAYLCYIAKKAGVKRFIHGGSCSVYGITEDEWTSETDETRTESPYGMSKLYAEQACWHMRSPDYSVICFRKGTVSGASPRMRFDLIVNAMTKDAVTKGVITINDPTVFRPILSVRDAVRAYITAVENTRNHSGIFNVASQNSSVSRVAGLVKKVVGERTGKDISIECANRRDPRSYRVSTKRIAKALDAKSTDSIEDIVADVYDNLPAYGDLDQKKYYNIATFKSLELTRKSATA